MPPWIIELYTAAPVIEFDKVPVDERAAANILNQTLHMLPEYVHQFFDAVLLYDSAGAASPPRTSPPEDWSKREAYWRQEQILREERAQQGRRQMLAARAGAMTIYHFSKAMEASIDFEGCKSLRSGVDASSLRIVRKLFRSRFPDFPHLRHAVSHSAELFSSVESRARNALKEGYADRNVLLNKGSVLQDALDLETRTFFTTFLGRVIKYQISETTLEHLADLTRRIYQTFPISEGRKRLAAMRARLGRD